MGRSWSPRAGIAALSVFSILVVSTPAYAYFNVISLHPVGATSSLANGIRNGQKVGRVDGNAAIWNSGNVVNTSLGAGTLYATDGVEQVGFQGGPRAWYGTPGSIIDLTPNPLPPNYFVAVAQGVFAGTQAGYIQTFSSSLETRATLWTDSGSGYIDLNPALPGAQSIAYGEYVGQQAGSYIAGNTPLGQHAAVWYSSAASMVDINPVGSSTSLALAVFSGRQGGYATFGGIRHAGTWQSSAASWNDLHPLGADESTVNAVDNGAATNTQAGYAVFAGVDHAAYWAGTAGSFEDLHSYLPNGYTSSRATGIWVSGGLAQITGWAYNQNGQPEAMLWVQAVPEPGSVGLLIGLSILGIVRRR